MVTEKSIRLDKEDIKQALIAWIVNNVNGVNKDHITTVAIGTDGARIILRDEEVPSNGV